MNQQKIGIFISRCRKEKGMTQGQLAERLGISKSCINHRMRKILELARTLSQD